MIQLLNPEKVGVPAVRERLYFIGIRTAAASGIANAEELVQQLAEQAFSRMSEGWEPMSLDSFLLKESHELVSRRRAEQVSRLQRAMLVVALWVADGSARPRR